MDETDTGPTVSPEVVSAEAARQWKEQQLAHARAQFVTPTWIGPPRTESAIPQQAEPEHDEVESYAPEPPVVPHDPIPATAHWAEKAKPRLFAGTVLVAALAGVIVSLVLTITTQAPGAIAGLAASAIVAVIFRGALMGSGITTVDLKGSILRIRNGGVLDIINLADPVHLVELVGNPDQPSWRLRVEAIDGRTVELGPAQVDAPELDRIVKYYRAIADRDERERARRFNR
jgi:hypothetical protein